MPPRQPFSELWALGALGDRDALLATVEQIVGLGTWVWDIRDNRVAWSDSLFRILGYEPGRDEATVENFYAALHPEDSPRLRAVSQRIAATGQAPTVHCRVLRRDGEVRHVRLDAVAVYDELGILQRLIGTVLDTTDSRARERHLAQTAELLNEAQRIARVGSWYWEPATGRSEWSQELFRILGVPLDACPSEELWFSVVHPADAARVKQSRDRALAGELTPVEFRIVTPAGAERAAILQSRIFGDGQDGPRSLIGIVLDVTDRRMLEEELRHAQKLEAIGRLAGGIAHDFNNLLAVIHGSAELLARSGRSAEVEDILAASMRGAALTRQLLAFSRRAVVRPTVLDLNERARGAMHLLERLIGDDVRVELELSAELWPVLADACQLEQVVMNLALNARDAMPSGGTLTIRTENLLGSSGEADQVALSVTDTGVGMPAAVRERIFEPFFTTKPPGQGTGLGLATVFGIVSQAGGRVLVDSEVGRGTTVRVCYPRACEARVQVPVSRPVGELTGSEQVLLVEDNDHVRSVMGRILEGAGYRVTAAADAQHAIELAQSGSQRFDILITDVVMPGSSGRQLAKLLVRQQLVRHVLYVTAYAPPPEDELPSAIYLQKPFARDELLGTVRSTLETAPN